MRVPFLEIAEKNRICSGELGTASGLDYGFFVLLSPFENTQLSVMVGPSLWWEHVSVSTRTRNPTWDEMTYVKELFFLPEECVIQYHPPRSSYVNIHRYCLHLWRPLRETIPMPPLCMV